MRHRDLLELQRRQARIRVQTLDLLEQSRRLIEEAQALLGQPVYPFPTEEQEKLSKRAYAQPLGFCSLAFPSSADSP